MTYQMALGIETGDVVTTSYGKTTYRVDGLSRPRYWMLIPHQFLSIGTTPRISLAPLTGLGDHSHLRGCIINDVRRLPDGRYFTDGNDQILVEKDRRPPIQMALFDRVDEQEPYLLQADVDYHALYQVFHCLRCARDYNAKRTDYCNPFCPHCGRGPGVDVFFHNYAEPRYADPATGKFSCGDYALLMQRPSKGVSV